MIDKLKKYDKIGLTLIIVSIIFGFNFFGKTILNYNPSEEIADSKKINNNLKIGKVCYELPNGVLECIELKNQQYDILYYSPSKTEPLFTLLVKKQE